MAQKRHNPIRTTSNSLAFQLQPDKEVKGPRLVLGYFGIFLIGISFLVLLPLIMLIFYPGEAGNTLAFLIPGLIAASLGVGLVSLIFKRPKGKLTSLEDLILVIGVWILVIIFSAIPYFFYGYTFTQAFFESTSGYTSAGLTVMDWSREITSGSVEGTTDVVNHMLFFHRAITELVGGIGLVLVVSSAISERSGLNLYLLEGHNDKLLPNLVKSARLIFGLYLGYIAVGTILYIFAGVTPFDALCHSITAVATGGFSTKSNNINTLVMEVSMNGEWRGVMVELITELLMLLGGTNFVIHYSLIRGRFNILKHFEYWVFFFILLFVWPFMILGFTTYFNGNVLAGFRYGTFEMLSGLSTAGFQAVDSYQAHAVVGTNFAISGTGIFGFTNISNLDSVSMAAGYASGSVIKFPTYLLFLLGLMMMVGMQNGSTTGAIKQNRVALLFMDISWRVKAAVGKPDSHHAPMVWKFGNKVRVDRNEVIEAETFIAMYVSIVLLGTTLVSAIASGIHLTRGDGTGDVFSWLDAFFEYSSAVGTVGLGCGITSYNNSISAGGQAILWIEMIGMLLGRLEIFVYFTLFGKIIHRIRSRKFIYNPEKEEQKIPDSKGKWDESGSPL